MRFSLRILDDADEVVFEDAYDTRQQAERAADEVLVVLGYYAIITDNHSGQQWRKSSEQSSWHRWGD